MSALHLAQRLTETEHRDLRLYAHVPLRRALLDDPEMTWQLMRRLGRRAERLDRRRQPGRPLGPRHPG